MKKIAYVALKYDYGVQDKGLSYESKNLEPGFQACVDEGLFEFKSYYPDVEDTNWNDLISKIVSYEIDAIFHVAFNEDKDLPEGVASIALKNDIPVIQWDCDASWRFENFIKGRKNRVSHFVSTHSSTLDWYENNGMTVIKSQWAGSPLYTNLPNLEKKYDVGFCGQKHGIRGEIVTAMHNADIDLHMFGWYWEGFKNGHPHTPELSDMLDVLHRSKVCLNMSNPWHVGTMPQIKGRHFGIPKAGGFQITTPADNLEEYFVLDKEIVVVNDVDELIEKTRYYLDHADERLAIAEAGHQRTITEHTWPNRMRHILESIGL
jgi:spore maturation protein CgeB